MKLKIFKFFKKNYFFLLYVLLFFHRAGHKGCNNKRKDKDVIYIEDILVKVNYYEVIIS